MEKTKSGMRSEECGVLAKAILERIEVLGRISEEPGQLTRTFCSEAMRRANDCVGHWMRAAGMVVREDAIGNLIGHYAAESPRLLAGGRRSHAQAARPQPEAEPRILLLGSHLDTVRNAGKYDGALGVLLGIACVEQLHRNQARLPFAIEVIGFSEEEGVRYQTAYLGSRVVAGSFKEEDLERRDADGISMAEAIRSFGGQPTRLKWAQFDPDRLLGYLEAHIEQGPVLEEKNLPVGIVETIAGQSRYRFIFSGLASHAGATPMPLRRDALCAAAEFVLLVEQRARKTSGLVATVGQIQVEPGASNVVPGTATLTLDVRHQTDSVRKAANAFFLQEAGRIGARRKLKVQSQLVQQTPAVACAPALSALLERAARNRVKHVCSLASGAGHDAAVLAGITSTAMLFIRCKGGVSHHPAESVKVQDVQVALGVMGDFVRLLAQEHERF